MALVVEYVLLCIVTGVVSVIILNVLLYRILKSLYSNYTLSAISSFIYIIFSFFAFVQISLIAGAWKANDSISSYIDLNTSSTINKPITDNVPLSFIVEMTGVDISEDIEFTTMQVYDMVKSEFKWYMLRRVVILIVIIAVTFFLLVLLNERSTKKNSRKFKYDDI